MPGAPPTAAPAAGPQTAMDAWLHSRAEVRERRGLQRGATPQGTVIDLASNDYLGLSADPRVIEAAVQALHDHGAGARASRVVCGTNQAHQYLEEQLCLLTGHDSALAFSSGYTANLGVLAALGGPGTLMIFDAHVHASLRDGIKLSRSPAVEVPHNDLNAIAAALAGRTQPRAVVVLESIYSVLGDAADLAAAAGLCATYDALLLVDEAHGIGVAGGGRGAVAAAGLAGSVHVAATATLSKALGSQGGAVLGSTLLREHLVNTARTFIFDTALAPAAAAAGARAAAIVREEPGLAAALLRNAEVLARRCGVAPSAGAVQSVPVGSAALAAEIATELRLEGVSVGCFRPPSVPDGVSRLRLTARANLTAQELDTGTTAVARVLAAANSAAESSAMASINHGKASNPA
ncbi:aminotransferase class I/II-fold pyridoxal phosphate-dependent enzyme [Arthrobacter psychrochitiniphilus]|uniref:aminotransferase class I/II-fold pyridoxal phosphate-dependent enzyme n=1 Tax=Arthrobacter psychrochitiniphilus TaxID=291045 RepID=UPI003F7CC2A6